VCLHEIWGFLFRDHLDKNRPTLEEFMGEPQDGAFYALRRSCEMDETAYPAWQEPVKEEQEVM